jgi:DNA-binding transcriptional LysR family regulator
VTLDLRRLQYFVEVADQRGFIRAAYRLHMTQPALSRQIAALESELGVKLFSRSRAGTALTTAGVELLERTRNLLRSASELERDARVLGRRPARFVVGFMPGVDAGALIDAFRRARPEVDVVPIFTSTTTQAPFLTDGRADVVFCRPPMEVDDICIVELFDEPLVAAVRSDHRFAVRPHLLLRDLDDLPQPVLQRSTTAGAAGPPDPFEPQEAILAVSAGQAVALLPAGVAAFYTDPGVRYIPVTDAPKQPVALAYDKRRPMPHIEAFADICRVELGRRIRELPYRLVAGERATETSNL